ncbi:MAG TPA: winged helix-turn-helix domain-containing protein [Solirubrobacterales bacterium]|nr:winged helix-turn-helix domain-containing protein [Solirubrobacterales bacterium]
MTKNSARAGQRGKSIEELVSYAVGHRIRIEVLAMLHEGVYCPNELAETLGEPLGRVTHHVNELLDGGSIELARTEQVRNTTRHFYRAVELPEPPSQSTPAPETETISPRFYSDEDFAAMPRQQRQTTSGLILQACMAEAMASLWAGKFADDPRVFLSWRWFNVDARGREEVADELASSWARLQQIEADATDRLAETDEQPVSVVVATQGFERSRPSPPPPPIPSFSKS